ncbi:ATP-binding protein [Pandoraea apista]|uniref:ATP-binding protein n=1 Tax=Pandoraea apista TaxID=93218 RepID=UPI00069957F9|nr:ATP-binding protein [Pandoraea apista]
MSSLASDLLPAGMVQRARAGAGADGAAAPAERSTFRPEFGTCEQHGQYPRNTIDEDGRERWFPDACPACAKQGAVRRLMQRAEISPRFEGCTFDGYEAVTDEQAQALEICRGYADTFNDAMKAGRCLILRGNPGTGKNHLAVAITKQVLAQGYTALHATAYEIVCRIRETWGRRGEQTEQDVTRTLGAVDLLVIDEVGRQYGTEGEQIHLFHVIDHRYRLMKPTIVISNKEPDEIRAYLGDAAYDRLREGGGVLVNFDWQSHRGGAA